MLTKAPKGTKDLMPEQAYKWQFLENAFSAICERYGFKEIRTPIFEHTELFARGVGDTTDIVEKQMYTFEDYAKRSITLKPEGTAGAARAFIENKIFADVQPTKMYYETPCFRYEKPQSGRLRQFHQFGLEIFGTNKMLADAEVISLAKDFIDSLGIKDIELRINSVGCPTCRAKHREALKAFLTEKYDSLCETCKGRYDKNPMRIIDCKSPVCQELVQGAPMMLDFLCDDCETSFEELKSNLTASGIEFIVDPGIVRGLDYYTKTAFEFVSNNIGAQGTVCGGGRYDHLIEELGGPATPGVGFGLGIERLLLVMEANKIEIPKPDGVDVFIAIMGDEATKCALGLVHQLRLNGFKAAIDLMGRNIKGQFKYSDRLNSKYTVVIGDNELETGKVQLKEMATSQQTLVNISEIVDVLKEKVDF